MGLGLLKNIKSSINLKGLLNNKVQVELKATPETILGYSLYPEQQNWLDFCFKNDQAQVKMLLGARGYGKTEVITKYAVIKHLLQHKAENPSFIIITRTLKRSRAILYSISSILKEFKVEAKFTAEEVRFKTNGSKEANILVTTLNAGDLRGHHVDYCIFDDPVISQDEKSEAERENAKLVFRESLNVAKRVIVLGQPVHEQDLYAMLLGAGVDSRKSFYNINNIKELNLNLELLQKTTTEREIQKNYFGELMAQGLYPFHDIEVAEFDFVGNTIATIDPSFQGKDAIGIAIGVKAEGAYKLTGADGEEKIINGEVYKTLAIKIEGDVYEQAKEIITILEHFKVYRCYIESMDNGGVLRHFKNLSSNISFVGFKESINKEVRIRSRLGAVKERIILHSESDLKEITAWTEGVKHDDCIDALASLINFLLGNKDKVKVIYG